MNKRVLVVEDNYLIGSEIVSILRDAEMECVGPVGTVCDALNALHAVPFDAALVDIKLGNIAGFPIAVELRQRAIPFAFVSGYERTIVPEEFNNIPFLGKPFSIDKLVSMVHSLCGHAPIQQIFRRA